MAESLHETWRKRVARWRESGLTAQEFAAKTGLNRHTLRMWSSQLRRERRRSGPRARHRRGPRFIELQTVPASGSVLEVALGDVVVRVPADFDQDALRRVLAVVRDP